MGHMISDRKRSRQRISVEVAKTSFIQGQAEDVLNAHTVEKWVIGSKLVMNSMDGNQVVGISKAQLQQLLSRLDNKNEGSSSQANAVTSQWRKG
ncbi:hypothetical protein JRO89_XS04G0075600 [Xanthoceras sorbifolium]|uniref:Uncharacterized protein n=1 Tax=Xanthoceras sorbifolium TaxID=99658 RepID=A0ABQ8I598_9ROSI|nr:hypothetical protein JRO89_XS04G0075600 [Xanthoceras sorbifolium]